MGSVLSLYEIINALELTECFVSGFEIFFKKFCVGLFFIVTRLKFESNYLFSFLLYSNAALLSLVLNPKICIDAFSAYVCT